MRIIQMLPNFSYGDAIGNDTLALADTLKEAGYDTDIYAMDIDPKLPKGVAHKFEEYKEEPGDIILYHLSTGSEMNYKISLLENVRIVIIYHNITPETFFTHYDRLAYDACYSGLRAAKYLGTKAEYCFADSEFNKNDLINMGYTCDIEVLPILIAFDDYAKKPNEAVIKKYSDDGYTNIVFTGRVAPNKKQEDLIAAFYYYHKYINPKSRLIIVGRYDIFVEYYRQLQYYMDRLNPEDVIFTGRVRFDEILAYYKIADVFLCLSEHEGFCVPLVESMVFDVPIIAYDSCAVGETLGGSGFLLESKEPAVVAEAINYVVTHDDVRQQMIENQKVRLSYFEHGRIKKQFLDAIARLVSKAQ